MTDFLLRLLRLGAPYRRRLILGVFFGVVAGLMSPALMMTVRLCFNLLFPSEAAPVSGMGVRLPGFLQPLMAWLDSLMPHAEHRPDPGLVALAITLIPLVMLVRGAANYLNAYLLNWAAIRAINDLRTRLFDHLHTLSFDFFNRSSTGELVSRISNDTLQMSMVLSTSLGIIITKPIEIISLVIFLVSQQPRLTLISMTVLPLCIVPMTIYSRKIRRSAEGISDEMAQLSNVMQEAFTANRVVKAYNMEAEVGSRFRRVAGRYFGFWMRAIRAAELPGPIIETFGAIGVAIVFLIIARETKAPMKAGDFISFVGSLFLLYQPIKLLSRLQGDLQRARSAGDRIFALLNTRPTVADPATPKPLKAAGADIVFDHVSFSYGEKAALTEFNLTIKAGQVVALVGQSGSGKTTVTNLLLRFMDPAKGSVRIGGVDLREVAQHDLRSQVAVVSQEVVLFNESIRQNIGYGRAGATAAEIEQAARQAHAHEFILENQEGYDFVVGEKGVTLSGGQRQRIAIARAILRNAPILVLDEATSALDNESERAVQGQFDQLMQGRTTLCIAHRLSTIQHADVIVVMDQGRIVETGRHAELLARNGVYRKLHDLSFQTPAS